MAQWAWEKRYQRSSVDVAALTAPAIEEHIQLMYLLDEASEHDDSAYESFIEAKLGETDPKFVSLRDRMERALASGANPFEDPSVWEAQ